MWRQLLIFLLVFLLAPPFLVHAALPFECGVGSLTKGAAFFFALPANIQEVNQCCHEHDRDILSFENRQRLRRSLPFFNIHKKRRPEAEDEKFCTCLDKIDQWYTRFVLQPVYCAAVKAFHYFYY